MTQPSISSRIKRGLIGGIISALLGGGGTSLLIYPVFGRHVQDPLIFVLLGFGFPALINSSISNFGDLFLAIVYWFLAGAMIGYFARNNRAAIGIWLLVYIISSAISIALWANMMN